MSRVYETGAGIVELRAFEFGTRIDVCFQCNRPCYLWGGPSCDHCDTDNDGILDKYTVGTGITTSRSVVPTAEKGFRIVASNLQSLVRIPLSAKAAIQNFKSSKTKFIIPP
jgi:hypothetical protein